MTHRLAAIVPVYGLVLAACYAAAYQLRFDFAVPSQFHSVFWLSLPFVLMLKAAGCIATGECRSNLCERRKSASGRDCDR